MIVIIILSPEGSVNARPAAGFLSRHLRPSLFPRVRVTVAQGTSGPPFSIPLRSTILGSL